MPRLWKEAHDVWKFGEMSRVRAYRMYHSDTVEHMARTNPWIMRRIINEYTLPGGWVLDPMCGVGTTLVEALSVDRNACGIESEERFAEIAIMNGNNLVHQSRMDVWLGESSEVECNVYHGYAEKILAWMAGDECYFDLITFSPPYEGINYTYRSASGRWKHEPDECRGFNTDKIEARDRQVKRYYSKDPKNIANFKGLDYWNAMDEIYGLSYAIGECMVVVVKNQIKNHKERDFAQETINFIVDRTLWDFKWCHLAMLPEPSHWENVRRKRYPDTPRIDWEHVLVFEK